MPYAARAHTHESISISLEEFSSLQAFKFEWVIVLGWCTEIMKLHAFTHFTHKEREPKPPPPPKNTRFCPAYAD